MRQGLTLRLGLLLILTAVLSFALLGTQSAILQQGVARSSTTSLPDVSVTTIIENSSVFPDEISAELYIAVGDVTNDGNSDLVFTKGNPSRAAVFQGSRDEWDSGILLAGPSVTSAHRPIVAPIRNDGLNWLVYSEHRTGNTGEWLRAHRYAATALVENADIITKLGWPGWFSPSVADLDGDGSLEIWLTSAHGGYPYDIHLRRHIWDPVAQDYPGVEIDVGQTEGFLWNHRPLSGDFLGNDTESLIWRSGTTTVELVTYSHGSGVYDHTSSVIFTGPGQVIGLDAGELDLLPGTDLAVSTWDGTSSSVFIVSGGTFQATEIATGVDDFLRTIRLADLDGDGLAEVYAAAVYDVIYGFNADAGWQQLANLPGIEWWDGTAVRWNDSSQEELLFVGKAGGRTFRVVSLSEVAPLDASRKIASTSAALPGDPVTYTISLNNDAAVDHTSVQVTDTLPLSLTYLDDSFMATAGSFGYANRVITWTGALSAGGSVAITFGTTISETVLLGSEVINSAIISGAGQIVSRTATLFVGHQIYLPVVMRSSS